MVIRYWKNPKNEKPFPIKLQDQVIRKNFPSFRLKQEGPHSAIWQGKLRPFPSMQIYTIEIQYTAGHRPKVFVISPPLKTLPGKVIPHLYRKNSRNKKDNLCLFLPNNKEFSSNSFIGHTIIPWTSHWLFCYEIWILTGEWVGGGVHPPTKK